MSLRTWIQYTDICEETVDHLAEHLALSELHLEITDGKRSQKKKFLKLKAIIVFGK